MTVVAPLLEHPGEPAVRRAPGDVGIWVFVLGDMVFFGAYFVIFMVYRTQQRAVFLSSQQHLSLLLGGLNTLLLFTGSRWVALAVQAARAGRHHRALRLVLRTAGVGALFVAVKLAEWAVEISHRHTLAQNNFFMFYFMLTGVHLFHTVLGLVFLGVVGRELRDPGRRRSWVVEVGATYWHMVDLLWVLIFTLLYLLR